MSDSVVFVSLGPGDPELITLKGLKELQRADLVFCPSTALSDGKTISRSMDILQQLGVEQSKIVAFDVPMNKDRALAIESYKKAAAAIAEHHRTGRQIAVAAEGDAGFYSSTHYISENLKTNHIATSRIAGVPAFIAAGALADIHVAKQEENLQVIPGVITFETLKTKLERGGTLVIMKASQCEAALKAALQTPHTEFHYFENIGVADREFYTSDKQEIRIRQFPYFSLLIIQHPTK